MGVFQASIVNTGTGQVDIQTANNCTQLVINDDSNYLASTDSGGSLANFNKYRIITVTASNGAIYTMSSLGGFTPTQYKIVIPPPSSGTQALTLNLVAPSNGINDGWYCVLLQVLPTWGSGYSYVGEVSQVYDSVNGMIYQAINNVSSSTAPHLDPTNWMPITQSQISAKYSDTWCISLDCNLQSCLTSMINTAFCGNPDIACDNMCNDANFQNAVKLLLFAYAINTATIMNQANTTTPLFNAAAAICQCP